MKSLLQHFVADESGATAVEYGIMVALIAVIIIGTVRILGTSLNSVFDDARLRGLNGS